jgi:hypothetical protein
MHYGEEVYTKDEVEHMLRTQGLQPGSEAYKTAMNRFVPAEGHPGKFVEI